MSNFTCSHCGKSLSGNWLYCSVYCRNAAQRARYGHTALPAAEESSYSPTALPAAEESRYGHTALPGAVKNQRYVRPCQQCGQMHKRSSQYCSNACKQVAYRRRKDSQSGSWARRRERANRAVSTKQWVTRPICCEHCGTERRFTIAQTTNRMYCSDKCKQAAYRLRKANNGQG